MQPALGCSWRTLPSLAVPLGAALGAALGAVVPLSRQLAEEETNGPDCVLAARELGKAILREQTWRARTTSAEPRATEPPLPPAIAQGLDDAWAHVEVCVVEGRAGGRLGEMVKQLAAYAVEPSSAQHALIHSAHALGLPPDARALNAALTQMHREARDETEVASVRAELEGLGAVGDEETTQILARDATDLARLRAAELHRLLTRAARMEADDGGASDGGACDGVEGAAAAGEAAEEEAAVAAVAAVAATGEEEEAAAAGRRSAATAAAWRLWQRLLDYGCAEAGSLAVMLRGACDGTEQRSTLMASAVRVGVQPNAIAYTLLISSMQIEAYPRDDIDALVRAAEARGVKRDAAMAAALRRSPWEVSRMRTSKLRDLVQSGGRADRARAHALLARLFERCAADAYQLRVMLSYGTASLEEMRALIARAEGAGLAASASEYNALLSRMQLEGRCSHAQIREVLDEMLERGVAPDERTEKIVHRSIASVSAMRTAELLRLLRRQQAADSYARRAAWTLFSALCERGVVDHYQIDAMRQEAQTARDAVLGGGASLVPDEQRFLANYERALAGYMDPHAEEYEGGHVGGHEPIERGGGSSASGASILSG